MVQNSFIQKLILTIFFGLVTASILWVMRHIVLQAYYENSNEGWKKTMYKATPTPAKPRY